jgi:hypothetical protein
MNLTKSAKAISENAELILLCSIVFNMQTGINLTKSLIIMYLCKAKFYQFEF